MNALLSICVLVLVTIVAADYAVPPPLCRKMCRDMYSKCEFLIGMCENTGIQSVCAKTCGKCKDCLVPEINVSTNNACEVETCKDTYPSVLCSLYKRHKLGCAIAGSQCRATCSLCKPCKLPPTPEPCSEDCSDSHPSCDFWKKEEYCNSAKGFPDVRNVCPLSCGRCKPCPTFVLPPTEEELKNEKRD